MIKVSDGERHNITLTIGRVIEGKLHRDEVYMAVDGHETHIKKEDLDLDSLNNMDPFFGGRPNYNEGT